MQTIERLFFWPRRGRQPGASAMPPRAVCDPAPPASWRCHDGLPHPLRPSPFVMSVGENGNATRNLEELDLLRDATTRAWQRARRLLEEIRRREA